MIVVVIIIGQLQTLVYRCLSALRWSPTTVLLLFQVFTLRNAILIKVIVKGVLTTVQGTFVIAVLVFVRPNHMRRMANDFGVIGLIYNIFKELQREEEKT